MKREDLDDEFKEGLIYFHNEMEDRVKEYRNFLYKEFASYLIDAPKITSKNYKKIMAKFYDHLKKKQ